MMPLFSYIALHLIDSLLTSLNDTLPLEISILYTFCSKTCVVDHIFDAYYTMSNATRGQREHTFEYHGYRGYIGSSYILNSFRNGAIDAPKFINMLKTNEDVHFYYEERGVNMGYTFYGSLEFGAIDAYAWNSSRHERPNPSHYYGSPGTCHLSSTYQMNSENKAM